MKRILAFLCLLLSFVCLTACDPGSYSLSERETAAEITAIELIEYTNEDQGHFVSWVPNHMDDLRPFDSTKATVLQVLEPEKQEDFLNTLGEADILYKYYAYDSPKGICIRLTYADGTFMIVWANYFTGGFAGYIGTYTADGAVQDFIGSFSAFSSFEALVTDYFGYELPKPE